MICRAFFSPKAQQQDFKLLLPWLTDHAATYRIRRFVPEEPMPVQADQGPPSPEKGTTGGPVVRGGSGHEVQRFRFVAARSSAIDVRLDG